MLTHAENYQVALTPADEQVLQRLDGIVPAGEPILTDGTADGGAWITVLTGNQTLLDKDWVYSSAAPEVVAALRGLCSAGAAQRLEHLGVRWVYLGARVATADPSADRSCPQGTSELSHVRLSGVDEAGPLLFRAEVASTPLR